MNKQILKDIIGEAKVILDIGSYDGKDARELAKIFNCKIHCFEPNDKVFKASVELIYYPVAIMEIGGRSTFYKSDHPQSSSVHTPINHTEVWPDINFEQATQVQCISLDSWHKGQVIDLIHADVNGSEGKMIKGATETLKHTRYLYIEVSDKELYHGQPKINEVIAMLPDFKIIGLYDFGENFGNILFANTKL